MTTELPRDQGSMRPRAQPLAITIQGGRSFPAALHVKQISAAAAEA